MNVGNETLTLPLKHFAKRHLPPSIRSFLQGIRSSLTAPPSEDANLHAYKVIRDPSPRPRLSLVLPTIAPEVAFGGILTGLDFFLELSLRTKADIRVILDDVSPDPNTSILEKHARKLGINLAEIEICPRHSQTPDLKVRANDIFVTFNWWVTLNIREVVKQQSVLFKSRPNPYLYLIQDYEPQFYPFSSAHMMARLAFDALLPYWAVFNTKELEQYCSTQGHVPTRSFVFEPKISESLRPFLGAAKSEKQKRLLVYGRPNVSRNCFPAICKGLSAWIEMDPDHKSWDIVSAGTQHRPMSLAQGRVIRSLGKLSLEDYGSMLQNTGVGLSLMSSPHPSYPPLEMAHFGILTITNRYANKDLSQAHDNIISVSDISAETLAIALRDTCARFSNDPNSGLSGRTHMPWFFRADAFECLDEITLALTSEVWTSGKLTLS